MKRLETEAQAAAGSVRRLVVANVAARQHALSVTARRPSRAQEAEKREEQQIKERILAARPHMPRAGYHGRPTAC